LEQNSTLQLQTNDTHEFVSDVQSVPGDVDVDWILYLDQTGVLHVRELLDPEIELWNSAEPVKRSKNNILLIGIIVGVIGGVLLIVIISVIWLYYAHTSKQRLKWSHSTNIWFLAKWINNLDCES
jgi:hypothetical protein